MQNTYQQLRMLTKIDCQTGHLSDAENSSSKVHQYRMDTQSIGRFLTIVEHHLGHVFGHGQQHFDVWKIIHIGQRLQLTTDQHGGQHDGRRKGRVEQCAYSIGNALIGPFIDAALDDQHGLDNKIVQRKQHIVDLDGNVGMRVQVLVRFAKHGHPSKACIEYGIGTKANHIECNEIETQSDHRLTIKVSNDLRIDGKAPQNEISPAKNPTCVQHTHRKEIACLNILCSK